MKAFYKKKSKNSRIFSIFFCLSLNSSHPAQDNLFFYTLFVFVVCILLSVTINSHFVCCLKGQIVQSDVQLLCAGCVIRRIKVKDEKIRSLF